MDENEIREALNRHWAASDVNDFDVEHDIYRDDALLEYPQSGERIRGRHNIQASRVAQPNSKRFTVRRIVGTGDLWVTEFILAYDGQPSYSVSIMEFLARDTHPQIRIPRAHSTCRINPGRWNSNSRGGVEGGGVGRFG
jgi:ketosteroid isomerase-like protein